MKILEYGGRLCLNTTTASSSPHVFLFVPTTGKPEPLVFHIPQAFFDALQQRISSGSTKKRLPNSTTGKIQTHLHADYLLRLLVKAGCFWRKKKNQQQPHQEKRFLGPPWFLAAFPLPAAKWEIVQLCYQALGQRTQAKQETRPLLRKALPLART